jgi:hypothetical protein
VAQLRRCITLNLTCADSCHAIARMAARSTGADAELLGSSLRHCAEICRACANECQKHAGMMEHCRRCAEVCRRCERACLDASGMLEQALYAPQI